MGTRMEAMVTPMAVMGILTEVTGTAMGKRKVMITIQVSFFSQCAKKCVKNYGPKLFAF